MTTRILDIMMAAGAALAVLLAAVWLTSVGA